MLDPLCYTLGALAAGDKGAEILPQLNQYADAIGLAFQVQDDILDVTSDTETLGKPQGSDLELEKKAPTRPCSDWKERNKKLSNFIKKRYKHWTQYPTIQTN